MLELDGQVLPMKWRITEIRLIAIGKDLLTECIDLGVSCTSEGKPVKGEIRKAV